MFYILTMVLVPAYAVQCDVVFDHFLEDIISAYKMTAPTIIANDDEAPKYCTMPWIFCLVNIQEEQLSDLVRHLKKVHKDRKQDGIIILGSETNRGLVAQLAREVPSMFTSNCPIFLPIEYDMVKLRLDSNIIFYHEQNQSYKLVDKFAVKGAEPITLVLGSWGKSNGIRFQRSMNRWERRIDLNGATLVNGFSKFDTKYQQWYQDQLSYITENLNLTKKDMVMPRKWRQFKNGSWGGGIGMVERGKVDVLSNGLGVTLHRSTVLDYTIATARSSNTLIRQRPKGSAPDMWVYLRIFGILSWTIFFSLLSAFMFVIPLASVLSKEGPKNYLACAILGLTTSYLYAIQLGSHPPGKQYAMRCLTLTISMLTLLVFIYYSTDITAEMTSIKSDTPVRTFEDVIHHDYNVVVSTAWAIDLLARAKPGSAKHKAYRNLKELPNYEEALQNVINDPKTLFYSWEGVLVQVDNRAQHFQSQAYALKMDDATYSLTSFGLQKNSEFRQIFNHFLQKQLEHGIIKRLYRKHHNSLYVHKEFGMPEPQPLGYDNVMFPYILLGGSLVASLLMAMVECFWHKLFGNK